MDPLFHAACWLLSPQITVWTGLLFGLAALFYFVSNLLFLLHWDCRQHLPSKDGVLRLHIVVSAPLLQPETPPWGRSASKRLREGLLVAAEMERALQGKGRYWAGSGQELEAFCFI